MKRILLISTCNDCPYFDYDYSFCDKLDKIVEKDKDFNHPIPEDCPLEKEKK